MQRHNKLKTMLVLIVSIYILTGCVEQKPLEKLGLITAVGYDLERENVLRGTVVVHKFDPMAQNITNTISVEANTGKGLRYAQNLESNQKLVAGQLRCVIYSKQLAKKGVIQLVDGLNRDSTIGNMVYLTVAEGSADKIINLDKANPKINLGTYIYNLIRQNVESEQILSPTLQEFNHNYYDIGKDPVLPILKVKGKDVVISGLALFKDDQYVAKLAPNKLFYIKLLSDKYRAGTQEFGFNRNSFEKVRIKTGEQAIRPVYNKLFINIGNLQSHTKIKLIDKKTPKFSIEIKLRSRLMESTEPLDYSKTASIKLVERKISQAMEKDINELLTDFQKLQIDPFGIGNEYRRHVRGNNLNKKEWRRIYKDATFEVKVTNTITKTGVID